jgi:predicted DNA-binding transcriptional regulator AlpA
MPRQTSAGPAKSGRPHDPLLTIEEVLSILRVARSTFDQWRELGRAPECIRLPNRQLRVRQSALDTWLADLADASEAI